MVSLLSSNFRPMISAIPQRSTLFTTRKASTLFRTQHATHWQIKRPFVSETLTAASYGVGIGGGSISYFMWHEGHHFGAATIFTASAVLSTFIEDSAQKAKKFEKENLKEKKY